MLCSADGEELSKAVGGPDRIQSQQEDQEDPREGRTEILQECGPRIQDPQGSY